MAESLLFSASRNRSQSNTEETERTSDTENGYTGTNLVLDYSYTPFDNQEFEEALANQPSKIFESVQTILGINISLLQIPAILVQYINLKSLDLSSNQLSSVPDSITECSSLTNLFLQNNLLEDSGFPKDLTPLRNLKEINLSGNFLTRIPEPIIQLAPSLLSLHLGGNRISSLPREIGRMKKLQVFFIGGNQLTEIPLEIGLLTELKVFVLCENLLETLPSSVSNLKQLKSLLLHRNRITALPVELMKLRNLLELSLRDNPLVVRFVRDLVYNPPSLLELAGRTIKTRKVQYKAEDLPKDLNDYLGCAHQCVNPKCKGVYFDTCVEHIKFVDFCGKYRVPLLQYLCSPKCSDHHSPAYEASSDSECEDDRMRKVLLG